MKNTYIKLFIGALLFGTLVALTVFNVPHAERLVDLIYAALLGLGITHLATPNAAPAPPADRQGGFAMPGLLAALGLGTALLFAGCATRTQPAVPAAQVAYAQACAAYGAAFVGALELRRVGRLSRAQVDQVTLLDSQVTPICTGPLPPDATTAVQQVTAAVTALTILEVAHQEK